MPARSMRLASTGRAENPVDHNIVDGGIVFRTAPGADACWCAATLAPTVITGRRMTV
ncbi:hypothetical protein [Streptomyces sp. NPDC048419]|uniref:hypothetical protein n=1 Tax=Streptomyces sp. NPDC048419 TaxID=3365547 RepID=UPI003717A8B4